MEEDRKGEQMDILHHVKFKEVFGKCYLHLLTRDLGFIIDAYGSLEGCE
jgi:hypothetical protein